MTGKPGHDPSARADDPTTVPGARPNAAVESFLRKVRAVPTRAEIIDLLATEREKLLARYGSFSEAELNAACTESEAGGEPWRPKDHLAHLAMIERAFQGMTRRTLDGASDPVGLRPEGADSSKEAVMARVHRMNEDNVDSHRHDSLDVLLADLASCRGDTLAMIAELSDEHLQVKIPGAPWGDGTIAGVLQTAALHDRQHTAWVDEGLAAKA